MRQNQIAQDQVGDNSSQCQQENDWDQGQYQSKQQSPIEWAALLTLMEQPHTSGNER